MHQKCTVITVIVFSDKDKDWHKCCKPFSYMNSACCFKLQNADAVHKSLFQMCSHYGKGFVQVRRGCCLDKACRSCHTPLPLAQFPHQCDRTPRKLSALNDRSALQFMCTALHFLTALTVKLTVFFLQWWKVMQTFYLKKALP